MFKKLFSSKKSLTKCVVLYSFRYDRGLTQALFDFLIEYFKANYNVQFKYMGFYDEKYDDKYGKYDTNYAKIKKAKWNEMVNISLDVDNLRDKKRSICVEFNITRPVHLTVVLNEEISFDFRAFVESVYPYFKAEYGFNYSSYDNYWATAYAIGDREHGKEVHNIKRLSKENFEQWLSKCEKISAGYVRDIYEENVLSAVQLNHSVNGRSLKEYIVSENMGELSMINNDLNFWKLNDDQLTKCREILYKTDLLI